MSIKIICRAQLFSAVWFQQQHRLFTAKKLSDKSSTFHFINVRPNNAFQINYQNCFLKYLTNKRVTGFCWRIFIMSLDILHRLLLSSHAAISFIQRSVPSKSTTRRKSCPTMTNYFLVMSVDEIFSRVLPDGKCKTTTRFVKVQSVSVTMQ